MPTSTVNYLQKQLINGITIQMTENNINITPNTEADYYSYSNRITGQT